MNAEKLRGMFGPSQTKTNVPNIMSQPLGQTQPQVSSEMPSIAEMKTIAAHMKGPEADMLKQMIQAMEKGDSQMQRQL